MKGVKLCGLLSVLFIIFGLLFGVSSDVNALKYPVNTIDFADDTLEFRKYSFSDGVYYGFYPLSHDFRVTFPNSSPEPSGFTFPHTWKFYGRYNSSLNQCFALKDNFVYTDGVRYRVGNYSRQFSIQSNDYTYNYLNLLDPDNSPFDLERSLSSGNNVWLGSNSSNFNKPDFLCDLQDYAYIDSSDSNVIPVYQYMPKFDFSSLINIPLTDSRFNYEKSKPYYYNYNKLYINSKDKEDGVVYSRSGILLSKIFGVKVPHLMGLSMNFQLFSDVVNRLDYEGSPEIPSNLSSFSFEGDLEFDSDYTFKTSGCYLSPTCVSLSVNNYNFNSDISSSDLHVGTGDLLSDGSHLLELNQIGRRTSVNCSVIDYHRLSDESNRNLVHFSCPYSPPSDVTLYPYIDFTKLSVYLQFGSISTDNQSQVTDLFTTDGDVKLVNFSIVTNDDYTEVDWSATSDASGGYLYDSPGYGVGDGSDYEPSFLESLSGMFDFTFLNPFSIIFNMFSGSGGCVHIPTFAGMLHAESDLICPWFPSNVRSILTPVLSVSSMMLVFGFAVRWLHSSSGNYFDDSEGISAGGLSFKNKFRRKK